MAALLRLTSAVRFKTPGSRKPPEVFCYTVVTPLGEEFQSAALDVSEGTLPRCGAFRIFSNVSFIKGISDLPSCHGCVEAAINGSMTVSDHSVDGQTALNTPIFLQVWRHIWRTRLYDGYAWTVKLDPDCAFSPARLRDYLALFPSHLTTIGGVRPCPPRLPS